MTAIKRESLWTLETYAKERQQFRARVMAHKKHRTLHLGPHLMLIFEDELTVRYQIQEMLRTERVFEEEAISAELDAYNPLVPDGSNWKATMMIEYPDPAERAIALAELRGIEDRCYVEAPGAGRVVAIADEDTERANADKTSAVHWLRFELPAPLRAAIKAGAAVAVGTEHPRYRHSVPLAPATLAALALDLD